jgi:ferredoxin
MQGSALTYLYLIPILGIVIWYWRRHRRLEISSFAALKEATEAGMLEPPTLHPEIDPTKCIGCKSCVVACPEQDAHTVLGMIGKKAWLIGPSDCIGHGACRTVCPAGAIKLVFGTATRGIDLPVVKPNFETDVPGIFMPSSKAVKRPLQSSKCSSPATTISLTWSLSAQDPPGSHRPWRPWRPS